MGGLEDMAFVQKGMALEERIRLGTGVMQNHRSIFADNFKDFLLYHMIYKNSGINESLVEMIKSDK